MFQVTFDAGDTTSLEVKAPRFNPVETQNVLTDPLFYAAKCCRLNSLMSSCIYAATYFILLTFVLVFYAFNVFFSVLFSLHLSYHYAAALHQALEAVSQLMTSLRFF